MRLYNEDDRRFTEAQERIHRAMEEILAQIPVTTKPLSLVE